MAKEKDTKAEEQVIEMNISRADIEKEIQLLSTEYDQLRQRLTKLGRESDSVRTRIVQIEGSLSTLSKLQQT